MNSVSTPSNKNSIKQLEFGESKNKQDDGQVFHIQESIYKKNTNDSLGSTALVMMLEPVTESQFSRVAKGPLMSCPSNKIEVLQDSGFIGDLFFNVQLTILAMRTLLLHTAIVIMSFWTILKQFVPAAGHVWHLQASTTSWLFHLVFQLA